MQIKFSVFLHCLRMGGYTVISEKRNDMAIFSTIMIRDAKLSETAETLYLCTEKTLPMDRRVPIILLCTKPEQSKELLTGYVSAAAIVSEGGIQEIYIELLRIQNQYLGWKTTVLSSISTNREPQRLVDLSEAYFTFPLAIFDEMGVLVAHTNHVPTAYEPFLDLLQKRHALPEVLQCITASPALSSFTIAEGPKANTHLKQAFMDSTAKNIYRNCCLRDKVIFRCCFFCHTEEPTQENLAFIEEFFSMLEQCITIHRDAFAQTVHGVPFLLMTLISGSYADRDYIRFCLHQNRIPLEGEFILISIMPDDPAACENITDRLKWELLLPWCLVYANRVQLLLNTQSGAEYVAQKLTDLEMLLTEYHAAAVVSEPVFDIFKLAAAYEQVKKAGSLCRQLHPVYSPAPFFHGRSSILFCREIYAHLLLDGNAERPEALLHKLNRFIVESPLKKEDILKTIYVHIANGCKYNATAQLLELHRNTVTNRIKQFEEALHLSFDNFEDCLNLIMAVKCLEL